MTGSPAQKRAVLVVGAGASIEYGAPSTSNLTAAIEQTVMHDDWMKQCGGDKAFQLIKAQLQDYLRQPGDVNFEHIYHCAHELFHFVVPSAGALNEYRPLLQPFLKLQDGLSAEALRPLCDKIVDVIYRTVSTACCSNPLDLTPFSRFLEDLQSEFVTRVYTTNYDDFILQAAPDLYTGFPSLTSGDPKRFEPKEFWAREDDHSVFHLHGAVHLGFPQPSPPDSEIGELYWFDDRAEAFRCRLFHGSDFSRMDGTQVMRTSLITGLDKLSRLQQRPLSHYYAALGRDLMHADVIYVIGSGLTDLHVNTWLKEARANRPPSPIIVVDKWPAPFLEATAWDNGRKETHLWHDLGIVAKGPFGGRRAGTGWTLAADRTAAIWDKGFQGFLAAQSELKDVLHEMRLP